MFYWLTMTTTASDVSSAAPHPSLYDEGVSMLMCSMAMYALANIRTLARQGKLSDDDQDTVLSLPVSTTQLIDTFLRNRDILLAECQGDVGVHINAFEIMHRHASGPINDTFNILSSSSVLVFDDEKSDSELVYGVISNRASKRLVVGFRGTVTLRDARSDLAAIMTAIKNPIASEASQANEVGVHMGIARYLLAREGATGVGLGQRMQFDLEDQAGDKSKFSIVLGQVRQLLLDHPDWRLYVTGHSLGGALATLTALGISALSVLPTPVTCITFGCPLVGEMRFRRAFQALERTGRVRCVRFVNDGDPIPLIPRRGKRLLRQRRKNIYRHVGNEIRMLRHGTYLIARPPDTMTYIGGLAEDIPNQAMHVLLLLRMVFVETNLRQKHSVRRYIDNLVSIKDSLSEIHVEDLYEMRGRIIRMG